MLINHDFPCDFSVLTTRQTQVLECLAGHMTSKEIARELDISPSMVDQHLRAIRNKLGGLPRRSLARLHGDRLQFQGAGGHAVASAETPVHPLAAAPSADAPPQHFGTFVKGSFAAGFLVGLIIGIAVALITMVSVTVLMAAL